ncbi:MAG: cobalt ECF transporter T component CbiQ [Firmicutes bacterium]|nr:cobalt ECF transporter T component CbiQ [Bacillota bacterium]
MLIDEYAWNSPLRSRHPSEKTQIMAAGMLVGFLSGSMVLNLAVFGFYGLLTVWWGRVRLRDYGCLLLLPGFFLAAGVLLLPISYQPGVECWRTWNMGGASWGITYAGLEQAGLLLTRALAMLAAMYFLCLTTPVVEIVSFLRAKNLPEVLCDLMYLVYRGIFLIAAASEEVRRAQELRLGYSGWRTSLNSMSLLISSVLRQSFRRSGQMTVAMMARGADGQLPAVPLPYPFSAARAAGFWAAAVAAIALPHIENLF